MKPYRVLRRGMSGKDVELFKRGLNRRLDHIPGGDRYKVRIEGPFDNATLRAWQKVRYYIGLPTDHPPTKQAQLNVRDPDTRRKAAVKRAKRRRRGELASRPRIVTARQLGMTFQYVWGYKGAVYRFAAHYSGSPQVDSEQGTINAALSFHNYHKSLGWGGGSYEYVVGPGIIVCMNPVNRLSAGVANQNTGMANVCVPGTGNDRMDEMTRQTVAWLFRNAHKRIFPKPHRMPRPIKAPLDRRGHREFPGQSTSCPGAYLPTYKELFRGA